MTRALVSAGLLASMLLRPAAGCAGKPVASAIRAELRSSSVPVLLPLPLPAGMGTVRSVSVIDAGRAGYYVGLSTVAHCAGALSCASFHVAGSPAGRLLDARRPGRRLFLADGTAAEFTPRDCSGASCTEASLVFQRGRANYEIDAKVSGNALATLESLYRRLQIVR